MVNFTKKEGIKMSESDNDKRILDLKKNIELKKKTIKQNEKFNPSTNCMLKIGETLHNINVLDVTSLIFLLSKLDAYLKVVQTEKLANCTILSGFEIREWQEDILSKIRTTKLKEEMSALKSMEDKLGKLLSDKKKTELELDDIENFLG